MKLYADEPGYREIRSLQLLVVSAIARVEVPSALWRKARTRELDDSAAGILVGAFELDFHGDPDSEPRFAITSLNESILVMAAREAARHELRAYDSVQLASALAVRQTDRRCDHFACFDIDLRRAASRESFTLIPETV